MSATLQPTGVPLPYEIDLPRLNISSGRGNTTEVEIHLDLFDPQSGDWVCGWFNAAELLEAVEKTIAESTAIEESVALNDSTPAELAAITAETITILRETN